MAATGQDGTGPQEEHIDADRTVNAGCPAGGSGGRPPGPAPRGVPGGRPRPAPRRRGPAPRHSREEVVQAAVAIADADGLDAVTFRAVASRLGTGVMSLYSYVPDKQTLVYDMVEQVSGEIDLPEPSGDWRADMHLLAQGQRAQLHRHPWLIDAVSHLQPLGPTILAVLEFALGALEPTGLDPGARLETFSLINGFIVELRPGRTLQPRSRQGSRGRPQPGRRAGRPPAGTARHRPLPEVRRPDHDRRSACHRLERPVRPPAGPHPRRPDPGGRPSSLTSAGGDRPLEWGQRARANFSPKYLIR